MDPPSTHGARRHARIEELLVRALEARDEGRALPVEELCRDDPELEPEVRSALEALEPLGLASAPRLEDGARLGPYRLVRRLGGGGMGIVFLAERIEDGARFALKVIRPDFALFDRARRRFSREIESVSRLSHPGIVPILDVAEHADVPYLVMPFLEGADLAALLAGLPRKEPDALSAQDLLATVVRLAPTAARGPRDRPHRDWTDACLDVVHQLAGAVAHAHEHGVVHRDIKPGNVMLLPDGRALLLDFGLAHADGTTPLTRTGSLLGSEPYLAPEQVDGVTAGEPRSDVYALGVLLYELLTLQSPFRAATPRRTRALVLRGEAPPVRRLNPGVPRAVETVCMKAFDRDPRRRYASAVALAEDLRRLREGRPVAARRLPPHVVAERWVRARPLRAGAFATAAVLVVGSLVFAVQMRSMAVRTDRARRDVERSMERADFVTGGTRQLLSSMGPDERRAWIDRLLAPAPGEESVGADTVARRRATAGAVLTKLQFLDDAEGELRDAVTLYEGLGPTHREDLARTLVLLGANAIAAGSARDALPHLDRAQALLTDRAVSAPELLGRVRHTRATALEASGRLVQALEEIDRALGLRRDWFGDGSFPVVESLGLRARILRRKGDLRTARRTLDEAAAAARELTDDPTRPASLVVTAGRAEYHLALDDAHRAAEILEELLELQVATAGALSLDVASTRLDLAHARLLLGDAEEALRQAETVRAALGPGHRLWFRCLVSGANALAQLGRREEAAERYREIAATAPLHTQGTALRLHARMEHRAGRLPQARALYLEAVERSAGVRPRADALRAGAVANLGLVARALGEEAVAAPLLAEARDTLVAVVEDLRADPGVSDEHLGLLDAEEDLARFLVATGAWRDAAPELAGCLARRDRLGVPRDVRRAELAAARGRALAETGDFDRGLALLATSCRDLETDLGADHRIAREAAAHHAAALRLAGRDADAVVWDERAGPPTPPVFLTREP